MKKVIGLLLLFTLLVTTVSGAFAKQDNEKKGNGGNKASGQVKIEAAQSTSTQQETTEQQIENQLKELETQKKDTQEEQKEVIKKQKEVIKQKKDELEQQKAEEKQQKAEMKADKKQETKKQTFKIKGSPVIQYGKFKLPIRPITKGLGATLQFSKETGVLTVVKDNTTIVIDFKNKIVTVNGVKDTDTNIFTVKNNKKMTVLIKYIASELGIRVKVDGNKVITETPQDNSPVVVTGSAITLN